MSIRRAISGLALAGALFVTASAADARLIDEDFDQEVTAQAPAGATVVLAGDGSGQVEVVDVQSDPADPFGPADNKSLLIRSTATSSATFSGGTTLQQGTAAFTFWPVAGGAYDHQRALVRLTGGSATDLWGPYLQFTGATAYALTSDGTMILDQPVLLNAPNEVEIHFDASTRTFTGTLNGEPLTALNGATDSFKFFRSPESLGNLVLQVGPKATPSAVFFDDLLLSWPVPADGLAWAGQGAYRVLVRVEPAEIGDRAGDELPADVELDFIGLLNSLGLDGKADMASVQVMRYEAGSGEPLAYGDYAYAESPYDRPFRWYDGAIPYDFPDFYGSISSTLTPRPKTRVRAGYFYNSVGDRENGRLAWAHSQEGNEPSHYAVYFDRMDREAEVNEVPPRAWIGDGMPRFDRIASSTTGADHTRIAVTDWTGNGLPDIVYGESYGKLLLMPNRGTAREPSFPVHRMLFDADDLPIDIGLSSAPLIVDWTGNGVEDVIVGSHWNRAVLFRNVGTNTDRKLRFEGFIEADGLPLELPWEPVVGRPEGAFARDYYPTMEAVDWTGNGELDLLAGGYVTGRIFFFENTGRGEDGLPILAGRGPLRDAAGEIINVGDWCAAPTVADFTGDGLPDLITGNMPMTTESWDDEFFLRYYVNVGSPGEPSLERRPFPAVGALPRVGLSSPRAVDWNGDGLFDLVVSARRDIYLFENVGTATEPSFRMKERIESRWGSATLSATQFLDWDGSGLPDMASNYTVWINSGRGNPYFFEERVNVLPSGVHIAHPSGIGDDWFYPRLYDFNSDGRIDVLFGDWWGHVRFHRNLSTESEAAFDVDGEKLMMVSGEPIKVGPDEEDDGSFVALQGARTTLAAADFSGDGTMDLVVGDTFGIVRFFENVGTPDAPLFALPVELGNLGIRTEVEATDWNNNGHIDVIAGAANGNVRVFLNTTADGTTSFAAGFDPQLPPVLQPRVMMVDLNVDGDDDLFIPSTQGSVWVERSFLQHGYAPASVIGVESREAVLGVMSYEAWLQENFTEGERDDSELAGPQADPDGASVPNLLRYGFGLSIGEPVSERLPALVPGEDGWKFQFWRLPDASDIDYIVERSAVLGSWETVFWEETADRVPDEGLELVRVPVTFGEGAERRFFRVRVVQR